MPRSHVSVLSDATSRGREKSWKHQLEGCSQRAKETGRIRNLVRVDSLREVAEFSPVYECVMKLICFHRGEESQLNLNHSRQSLHICQLPAVYNEVENSSKTGAGQSPVTQKGVHGFPLESNSSPSQPCFGSKIISKKKKKKIILGQSNGDPSLISFA